jgi:ectoine hydroxylase-related dioxygenase (phytanoyl-CoA dioxygenase family)
MIRSLIVPSYEASSLEFLIANYMNVNKLSRLHEFDENHAKLFKRENDQSTYWHRKFYEFIETQEWKEAYSFFIEDLIERSFKTTCAYQTVPTFRIQYPGNVAVGEYHKDADYGHSIDEINCWVPLTDAVGTAAIEFETPAGFKSVDTKVGDVLIFDGANLRHGNQLNTTGQTRVSFDLRIIPMYQYKDNDKSSINTGNKFIIGDYFTLFEVS